MATTRTHSFAASITRSRAAVAGLVVGAVFAGVSVYWGLGGSWLLGTVGGTLASQGRAGSVAVLALVWVAAALKLVAAVLPMTQVSDDRGRWHRVLRLLTWAEAVILTGYGLVLTTVGVLVQTGVITASPTADRRALAWHAWLWDPWFLLWGLLVFAVLFTTRVHHRTD